jgi:hypothetical protein
MHRRLADALRATQADVQTVVLTPIQPVICFGLRHPASKMANESVEKSISLLLKSQIDLAFSASPFGLLRE